MCAIFGLIKLKGYSPKNDEQVFNVFEKIADAAESRGRDASGFGCVVDNEIQVLKNNIPMNKMLGRDDYKAFMEANFNKTNIIIGHTRATTQGTEKNNVNNHPVINGDGTAIVTHNGMINNYKDVVKDETLQVKGEVDSEAIIALWDKYNGNINDVVPKLRGGMSFAILNKDEPNKVQFYRNTNPLVLGYCSDWNVIFYASIKMYIEDAIKTKKFGLFSDQVVDIKFGESNANYLYNVDIDAEEVVTWGDEKLESMPLYSSYSTPNRSQRQAASSRNAYAPNNNFIGVKELFEARETDKSNKNVDICSGMRRDNGQFILEGIHPIFLFTLEKLFKQWTDLIIENSVKIATKDNGISTITLVPNNTRKGGKGAKGLSKLLLKCEHAVKKYSHLKRRMDEAEKKMLDKIDRNSELISDNTEHEGAYMISSLIDDEDAHYIGDMHTPDNENKDMTKVVNSLLVDKLEEVIPEVKQLNTPLIDYIG